MKWRGSTTADQTWHSLGVMTEAQVREALGVWTKAHPEICKMCSKPVHMMIFRGTGYCCELCEQAPF